jgi:hypothetical protein
MFIYTVYESVYSERSYSVYSDKNTLEKVCKAAELLVNERENTDTEKQTEIISVSRDTSTDATVVWRIEYRIIWTNGIDMAGDVERVLMFVREENFI